MSASRVEVAAAVLLDEAGRFLLAQRPPGKIYAGFWEFPGGKVERGEGAREALVRELHEELGIEVTAAYPWLTRDYDYEHARVRLRFYRVTAWTGELHGREDQRVAWQRPGCVTVGPLLPANGPVLRALLLPPRYALTRAHEIGRPTQLARLATALEQGLRLIQVREHSFACSELISFARDIVAMAHPYGARVLVNADEQTAAQAGADGVHLTSAALMRATARPAGNWCAASCHSANELEQARAIGLDFVVLGPVHPTASHPGVEPLGWTRYAQLSSDYPLPVYALGGMQPHDLTTAMAAGAHGIAMMRAAWQ